jgi:hypothetical protein
MAFDLEIAVKHALVDLPDRQATEHNSACPVTIVDVTGEISAESATDLTLRLDDVVTKATSSVIIRFAGDVRIGAKDRGPIETIARWIMRRRRDGISIYLSISDAAVREVFAREGELESVMLPFGADDFVPRRFVADQHPDHKC